MIKSAQALNQNRSRSRATCFAATNIYTNITGLFLDKEQSELGCPIRVTRIGGEFRFQVITRQPSNTGDRPFVPGKRP